MGLSPRVRGNPLPAGHRLPDGRSIPACAGEPHRNVPAHRTEVVYPRVCGGTWGSVLFRSPPEGLSPRVRGNRSIAHRITGMVRSIPACAGEPRPAACPAPGTAVYPRVCGGTVRQVRGKPTLRGLSPRVRGNLGFHAGQDALLRSIPACAGEPRLPCRAGCLVEVYPRVCGGTSRVL